MISFHEEVCVLSLGLRSRMHMDPVIFKDATSLQRRNIPKFRVDAVMLESG